MHAKLSGRWGQAPQTVARNSIGRSFNKVRKRCNSNNLNSMFEIVAGELHAKLRSSAAMCARAEAGPGCGARGRRQGLAGLRGDAPSEARSAGGSRAGRRPWAHKAARPHRCGGRRRDLPRCRWAAAGPGRHHTAPKAPPVWRAPEGPEGTGGLRGAAPNEVRTPSLAGGRALRRPEHQRRHKQHHAAAGDLSGHSNTEDQANLPYSPPPGSGRPV